MERGEKTATKFDGECRYCLKREHKKSECRKMKSDIAASVTRVASRLGLGMDDTLDIPPTRGSEGSDARGFGMAQRTAPDLVLWSNEPGGLLEPAQEERKVRGESVPIGPNPAEKATHELTHTSFGNWCSYCVRAGAADDPHRTQPHKEPELPDHHGGPLLYAGCTWQ